MLLGYDVDWSAWAAGIAALAATIAAFSSYYSAKTANKLARKNLRMTAELEIAKFEEKRINEIRNEMLAFVSAITRKPDQFGDFKQRSIMLMNSRSKLTLLFKDHSAEFLDLIEQMSGLIMEYRERNLTDPKKQYSFVETGKFLVACNNILRDELNDVKNNLRRIHEEN